MANLTFHFSEKEIRRILKESIEYSKRGTLCFFFGKTSKNLYCEEICIHTLNENQILLGWCDTSRDIGSSQFDDIVENIQNSLDYLNSWFVLQEISFNEAVRHLFEKPKEDIHFQDFYESGEFENYSLNYGDLINLTSDLTYLNVYDLRQARYRYSFVQDDYTEQVLKDFIALNDQKKKLYIFKEDNRFNHVVLDSGFKIQEIELRLRLLKRNCKKIKIYKVV